MSNKRAEQAAEKIRFIEFNFNTFTAIIAAAIEEETAGLRDVIVSLTQEIDGWKLRLEKADELAEAVEGDSCEPSNEVQFRLTAYLTARQESEVESE